MVENTDNTISLIKIAHTMISVPVVILACMLDRETQQRYVNYQVPYIGNGITIDKSDIVHDNNNWNITEQDQLMILKRFRALDDQYKLQIKQLIDQYFPEFSSSTTTDRRLHLLGYVNKKLTMIGTLMRINSKSICIKNIKLYSNLETLTTHFWSKVEDLSDLIDIQNGTNVVFEGVISTYHKKIRDQYGFKTENTEIACGCPLCSSIRKLNKFKTKEKIS